MRAQVNGGRLVQQPRPVVQRVISTVVRVAVLLQKTAVRLRGCITVWLAEPPDAEGQYSVCT